MPYGFPQEPARTPIRQPQAQGKPMLGRRPGRPMPTGPMARPGAQKRVFNPEQEMEIRRIIQQEMKR